MLIGPFGPMCMAQTLTNSNFSLQPGDQFTYRLGLGAVFGQGGVDLTWDYSSLEFDNSENQYYFDPSTVPSSVLFPSATVADHDPGGGVRFYRASDAGLDYLGLVNGWDTILFEDPNRLMGYPLGYGNSYEDDYHVTIYGADAQVGWGHKTHSADGTGDLILPFGTISNVLRVHSTSINMGTTGGDTASISHEWYSFYKPGVHSEVLTGESDGSWTVWLDEYSIGMADALLHPIGIDLLPNPATSAVELIYSHTGRKMTCTVLDATGRVVLNKDLSGPVGIGRHRIDLGGWGSGLYSVRITDADGALGVKRLIVQ